MDADQHPEYRALCSIERDGKTYPAGSRVRLPADTAARLLAMELPAIEVIADAPAAEQEPAKASAKEPPKAPPAARANARDTIERVRAIEAVAELLELRDAEEAHADGARKGVLDAIDKRIAALNAEVGEGEGDDESEAGDGPDGEGDGDGDGEGDDA